MDIISTDIHSTLFAEVILALLCTLGLAVVIFVCIVEFHHKHKRYKKVNYVIIPTIVILIAIGWVVSVNRSYEYEIIEANVSNWNEVMVNPEYVIIERNDNWVKLERKLEE